MFGKSIRLFLEKLGTLTSPAIVLTCRRAIRLPRIRPPLNFYFGASGFVLRGHRSSARCGGTLCQITCQKQSALSTCEHIQIAIAVDVEHLHFNSAAHSTAIVDQVANPFHALSGLSVLVPIHTERLAFSWIASIMSHIPLADNKVQVPVAAQIRQR